VSFSSAIRNSGKMYGTDGKGYDGNLMCSSVLFGKQ
jgi:hypothetical protein